MSLSTVLNIRFRILSNLLPHYLPGNLDTESEVFERSEEQYEGISSRGFGRGGGRRGRGHGRGRGRGLGRDRGRGEQVAPNEHANGELALGDLESSEDDDSSSKEEDVPGNIICLKDGSDFVDWSIGPRWRAVLL